MARVIRRLTDRRRMASVIGEERIPSAQPVNSMARSALQGPSAARLEVLICVLHTARPGGGRGLIRPREGEMEGRSSPFGCPDRAAIAKLVHCPAHALRDARKPDPRTPRHCGMPGLESRRLSGFRL